MKKIILMLFGLTSFSLQSQTFNFQLQSEKFNSLPFGSVLPEGWLKTQMQGDLNGFVGNLDKVVPRLINDSIYSERLHKNSVLKDLGNVKDIDFEGIEQYKWWNSETQSNWWDGYIRNVLLLNDTARLHQLKQYVDKILATQDADGYLGIYDPELRYKFNAENGELWAKTTLFRGLLAYYEYTNDQRIWTALVKAVDNVMQNYPINKSNPFDAGTKFTGGVAHGLTFTDICDRMYKLSGNDVYRKYALFLYLNFSKNITSEKDVQLNSILNPNYLLQSHGVHTYEHIRPLILAAYSSPNDTLKTALSTYLKRIREVVTISGGPIGDEWIQGKIADETFTGYEYCSIQELTDSYSVLLQKTGDNSVADKIEKTFYNAAQGARNPEHSCIAYLKTDNSNEMNGSRNGQEDFYHKQTRYKYSPAHQDVAVCCSPNAGRITPYFVQNMWMKEGENTLVATLLGPCSLKTQLGNTSVQINEVTDYPYKNELSFKIITEKPISFRLKIRKPEWAKTFACKTAYVVENDYIIIDKVFEDNEIINVSYDANIELLTNLMGEQYCKYGALLYAYPVAYKEILGRSYLPELNDYTYIQAYPKPDLVMTKDPQPEYKNGKIQITLLNFYEDKKVRIELVPFGKTILRQLTFRQ